MAAYPPPQVCRLPYREIRAGRDCWVLDYRVDPVHSAAMHFGHVLAERRMAAVFLWMAS